MGGVLDVLHCNIKRYKSNGSGTNTAPTYAILGVDNIAPQATLDMIKPKPVPTIYVLVRADFVAHDTVAACFGD